MYIVRNHSKKFISAITAVIVLIISLSFVNEYVANAYIPHATSFSRSYKVYDAATGQEIDSYSLNALPSHNNTRSIIGADNRVVDYTKSGVVKIMSDSVCLGTGFVIDSHVIATTAQVIYNETISGIQLFNSNGTTALTATPVEYHIYSYYGSLTNNYAFDYALISVEEDLSAYNQFRLGVATPEFDTSNKALSVTGFSDDTNNMMTSTGNVIDLTENISNYHLGYTADVTDKTKGAPVYVTTNYDENVHYTVIAIHSYGHSAYSRGTRITPDLLQFYLNNDCIYY